MYALTEEQYQIEAEPIFLQVFVTFDAFNKPFSSKIIAKRILYPLDNYLKQPFLQALIEAATKVGDIGCYLSVLWQFEGKFNNCYIPLLEMFEGYTSASSEKTIEGRLNMCIIPEYILCSAKGKWGLIVSDERHGILGGSEEFIEVFYKYLPNLDDQVYDFLERMQDLRPNGAYKKLGWLLGMLTHVYGRESAEKMLKEMESF